VLAEQVMQLVTARGELDDQVLVIQLTKVPAGLTGTGAVQGGGGVPVEAGARDQAKPAEQPLRACGEVGIGTRSNAAATDRFSACIRASRSFAAASSAASPAAGQAGW
jgi:hypothetical protein